MLALLGTMTPLVAADAPWLKFQGSIDDGLGYRVDVEFATSVNQRSCQFADYITGMWVPLRENAAFEPQVEGGSHQVTVPLSHPSGAGDCGWQPLVVSLCVGPEEGEHSQYRCHALFMMQGGDDGAPADRQLQCNAATGICTTPTGAPVTAQRISEFNRTVSLEIKSVN